MNEYLIEIEKLNKFFNSEHILKNVDLKVKQGEMITIIGGSGCGKTTLLRCLNCLEILDSGKMTIDGIVMEAPNNLQKQNRSRISKFLYKDNDLYLESALKQKIHSIRSKVGMLFQNLNLFPHLTVLENVALAPIHVKQMDKISAEETAKKIICKVGLEKYMNRRPFQISGGQAQRVAIARALAMNPKVMLYDEPTSALDPNLVGEVIQVMKKLNDEGMTQIVVTHDMKFAKTASDYVIYMEDGEIIEKTAPDQLFANPKDDRTIRYLNIIN